jgi:hypothetical protein
MVREEGSVLLTTLVLLVSLLFMGGILVSVVRTEVDAALTREASVRALYLAHAAVARSAWELDRDRYGRTLGGEVQDGNVPTSGYAIRFHGGYIRARFDPDANLISGTGIWDDVERTLVLRVDAAP